MTHLDAPSSICRLGVARGNITPPVGIYHRMWGAATHDRATGVHRPLTATACILQAADQQASPATEVILLAVDHCLLWAKEMQELIDVVARGANVAPEQ